MHRFLTSFIAAAVSLGLATGGLPFGDWGVSTKIGSTGCCRQ